MSGSRENESKTIIRRWFEEVWNLGRSELIDELRAPDAYATGLGQGTGESRGAEPFRAFYWNMRDTFPDLHVTVEDIVAEGDKVSVRITMEGTHMGDALAAATGRKVKFAGIVMARIVDGRIGEAWNNIDQLGLLQQIGALPPEPGPDRFLARRR